MKISNKEVLDVKDIQEYLGIGKSKAYELVKSGQFPVVRIGKLIKISRYNFERWLHGGQSMSN